MHEKIKIIIADDHALVRDGIRARLELEENFEIIAEAADGFEAIEKSRQLEPHLVILDISMPRCNGLEAARQIRAQRSRCRILILSMHDNPEYIRAAVKTGANGYLLKDIAAPDMIRAINTIAADGVFFSRNLPLDAFSEQSDSQSNPYNLTEREMDVLEGIAQGKANKEIAENLGIGVRTVESHRQRMREKLGGGNAAQLTRIAMEMGLVVKLPDSTWKN